MVWVLRARWDVLLLCLTIRVPILLLLWWIVMIIVRCVLLMRVTLIRLRFRLLLICLVLSILW